MEIGYNIFGGGGNSEMVMVKVFFLGGGMEI